MLIKRLFARLRDPEPGEAGGGEITDRGDDFVPTGDDAPAAAATPDPVAEAEAAALETQLAEAAADTVVAAAGDDTLAGAGKDDPAKPKRDDRIPLSRHKEILDRERERREAVERELAQFQNGQTIADVNGKITALEDSVLKMETDYATLLTDGKNAEAAALMTKIRHAERQMNDAKSEMRIQAAESRAVERTRFATALERIEASYPVLNPDHADHSPEKEAEVLDLKAAYETRGLTPTAALQKAVSVLLGATTTRQEIATTTNPRVSAADVAAQRAKDAASKAATTIGKTPASLAKVGADSTVAGGGKLDAKAVMNMSQADFAQLAETDLSALRGDTL